MSKSLGNVISVDELLEKYTSNQFRIFCLLSEYQRGMACLLFRLAIF